MNLLNMLRVPVVVFVVVCALCLPASSAHAQQFRWELFGTLTTGFTDNAVPGNSDTVSNQRFPEPRPNFALVQADAYIELAPGARITFNNGRIANVLTYTFFYTYYLQTPEARSFNNTVAWTMLWDASRSIRLGVGVVARQGQENAINDLPASANVARVQSINSFDATVTQMLTYRISPRWDLEQQLQVAIYQPYDAPTPDIIGNLTSDLTLTVNHRYRRMLLGFRAAGTLLHNFPVDPAEIEAWNVDHPAPDPQFIDPNGLATIDDQLILTASAIVGYDFNYYWSGNAELGGQISAPADFGDVVASFIGRIGVSYRLRRMRFTLTAAHEMIPNAQTGDIFIGDRAALNVTIPIGPRHWQVVLQATGSYGYERALGLALDPPRERQQAHVILADVVMSWRFHPMFDVSLRYQYQLQQHATGCAQFDTAPYFVAPDAASTPAGARAAIGAAGYACPTAERSEVPDFFRNLVTVNLTFNYPPRRGRRQGNVRLGSSRVDQSNWNSIFDPNPGRNKAPRGN
jgi:hypothetical protein